MHERRRRSNIFDTRLCIAISDLELYLQREGLNILWIYPGTIPFQYLKMIFAIQISEVNSGKDKHIYFELFEVWVLNFSLKEKTMTNIHNQNVANYHIT